LPKWIIANSLRILQLDNYNESHEIMSNQRGTRLAAQAATAEKRQQEDKFSRLAGDIRSVKKDLQTLKGEMRDIAYYLKGSGNRASLL